MGEHTPGPWTWWTSNSWLRLKHDNRGKSINVLEPYVCKDGQPDLTISYADMALIAAAPELLEALRRVAALDPSAPIGEPPDPTFFIRQAQDIARAAIAKAEGRS